MSKPEVISTHLRVSICDETVDVKARIDSWEDVDELIGRLQWAAEYRFGAREYADEGEASEEAGAVEVSQETFNAENPPLDLKGVMSCELPLAGDLLAAIVAEKLTDDEFERLAPRQREVIALRRIGLTNAQVAQALGVSAGSVGGSITFAREKGILA